MRATMLHQGVPVGVGELTVNDMVLDGDFTGLPGFARIRPVVRDAQRAASNFGFLPPGDGFVGGIDASGDAAGRVALDALHTLTNELELRTVDGTTISCEWLELWETEAGFRVFGAIDDDSASSRRAGPP